MWYNRGNIWFWQFSKLLKIGGGAHYYWNVAFNVPRGEFNTNSAERHSRLTRFVVLSREDEFLDNAKVEEYYGTHSPAIIYTVDTCHSNTMKARSRYIQAFRVANESHKILK